MLAQGIRVLSDADRERVHAAAIDILEKGGVSMEERELYQQFLTSSHNYMR